MKAKFTLLLEFLAMIVFAGSLSAAGFSVVIIPEKVTIEPGQHINFDVFAFDGIHAPVAMDTVMKIDE